MMLRRFSGLLVLFLAGCLFGGGQVLAQDEDRAEGEWFPQILEREKAGIASERESPSRALYLPDFSYAGYRWGEEPLPEHSPTDPGITAIRVTEFGAVPGDGKDDTEALREALAAAHDVEGRVLVRFPAGRLILKEILFIERSNIVLQGRGSGEEGTELYVPRPLRAMSRRDLPERFESRRSDGVSQFSWSGGVIWVRDPSMSDRRALARLVAGRRGQHTIRTNQAVGVQEGDVVEIEWYNREGRDGSLLHHIYCTTEGLSFGTRLYEHPEGSVIEQEVTVEKAQGKILTIKEPLLHDLRRDWTPTLTTAEFLENVGIEHLRITFPDDVSYQGHHNEPGYNGLYLTELLHSWVRDVAVFHPDSGILTKASKNITITDVHIGENRAGHYTIHLGFGTYGALVKDFEASDAIHNPSFNTRVQGSVYSDGLILDPRLDQHKGINNQNLFDNLRTRYPDYTEQFVDNAGSWKRWRPDAGAFNTLWNLEVGTQNASGTTVDLEDVETAPYARIIGVHGSDRPIEWEYGPNAYIEGLNRPGIDVPSLYEYQLQRRLNGKKRPSLAIYNPLPGYRYKEGEQVQIAADIAGNFEADAVKFMVDGEVVGTDTDGTNGWSVEWEAPSKGPYTLQAEATSPAAGETLTARPQSCTGEDVNIWVGDQEGILEGNYPNPFHTETTIEYALAEPQYVRLQVYDTLGRRVKTLVKRRQSAGRKKVAFDGRGLASGVYFYRLNGENFNQTGKATIVR
ncbi:T9SS type A sorting domain-containing protein [Salinibacter sp.]|uniref:T9SS type A sorting domain-containing protein n=1 Tax=Salinibacter sp. TaxID=2065818 RepID=UPI0021E98686|nr:T9SS type A sorting domain-containing protein [Salinibacter sp.]